MCECVCVCVPTALLVHSFAANRQIVIYTAVALWRRQEGRTGRSKSETETRKLRHTHCHTVWREEAAGGGLCVMPPPPHAPSHFAFPPLSIFLTIRVALIFATRKREREGGGIE